MAGYLQLDDLKDIPASPCLSSRIETGVVIEPEYLKAVDTVENYVRSELNTDIVRFRIWHDKVALELSPNVLCMLSEPQKRSLLDNIRQIIMPLSVPQTIEIASYHKGSAFIGVKNVG